jgi:hypothetical protein
VIFPLFTKNDVKTKNLIKMTRCCGDQKRARVEFSIPI